MRYLVCAHQMATNEQHHYDLQCAQVFVFDISGAHIFCHSRLSFVTEQVAAHTNGTIGALLNATFGNAPELLISTAALRSGFYRVVQLAMLGSMLTNLLFVFGVSCLVGGLRWQVQELRITSGNVSVLMLLLATAGSLLPAALSMSGQMQHSDSPLGVPSDDELFFCRINAFVMIIMYLCYLLFQLGTHKEEFDEDDNIVETPEHLLIMSPHFTSRHGRKKRAERNRFCLRWFGRGAEQAQVQRQGYSTVELMERGGKSRSSDNDFEMANGDQAASAELSDSDGSDEMGGDGLFRTEKDSGSRSLPSNRRRRRRTQSLTRTSDELVVQEDPVSGVPQVSTKPPNKSHDSDQAPDEAAENGSALNEVPAVNPDEEDHHAERKYNIRCHSVLFVTCKLELDH